MLCLKGGRILKNVNRRSFLESAALLGGTVFGSLSISSYLLEPLQKHSNSSEPVLPPTTGFVRWSFGGVEKASPVAVSSSDFHYSFSPSIIRKRYSFRAEVFRACEKIDQKRAGKTVALCLSGGVDSEIIALALRQRGIPFELYFLDNWGLNRDTYTSWVKPLENKLGKKAHVVGLGREYFLEDYSKEVFSKLGFEYPTYLAMTYLFSRIPHDQYIVVGDGDLDRAGDLYSYLGQKLSLKSGQQGLQIPFSSASVAYALWAEMNKRPGEYYFFSSTPELIAATVTDPRYLARYPYSETKEVIYGEFPEIGRRRKTTNWDGILAQKENWTIRHMLRRHAIKKLQWDFWQPAMGTVVQIDRLFYPSKSVAIDGVSQA